MRPRSARPGFTVMEVIVALAVGALVLLGTRALLESVSDQSHRVAEAGESADRDGNAYRILRDLVVRTDLSREGAVFGGDRDVVQFDSWCDAPGGWLEPCRVILRSVPLRNGFALMLTSSLADSLTLWSGAHRPALRYLASASGGGEWFDTWGTGVSAPLGLGVSLGGDTLILPVGAGR